MNANGIIIVDKPAGPTSHDVVARVRQILHTRRVGHTGTLDPFATGVLIICFGRATRLAQFFLRDEKEYIARMRLGWSTDTGDLTGAQLSPPTDVGNLTREQISTAFEYFRGHIKQVPPMYAAKKINGVKLYEMARRGQVIERTPIDVEIKELELLGVDKSGVIQDITFRVVSSSGTYVRVLAEDIGYERFITMLLVSLDPKARMLTCANAGHLPGYVFNAHGEIKTQLKRSGIPLGLKPDTHYPPGASVKLERGDTVLLLTDGIDEAMSPDNTIFGIERALEIVRTHRSKTARDLVETLYAGVRQFSQNTPQQDDVTAVVIKAV